MNREDTEAVSFDRPQSLGHLLAGVIRRRGVTERSAAAQLNRIWSEVAGNRIAQRSAARRLRGGILEIGVRNGAVMEELSSYLRNDLLQALQRQYPDHGIRGLKFIRTR